jgi:hypothetical protein
MAGVEQFGDGRGARAARSGEAQGVQRSTGAPRPLNRRLEPIREVLEFVGFAGLLAELGCVHAAGLHRGMSPTGSGAVTPRARSMRFWMSASHMAHPGRTVRLQSGSEHVWKTGQPQTSVSPS